MNRSTIFSFLASLCVFAACNGQVTVESTTSGGGGSPVDAGVYMNTCQIVAEGSEQAKLCVTLTRPHVKDVLHVDFCRYSENGPTEGPSEWAFRLVKADGSVAQDNYPYALDGEGCAGAEYPHDGVPSFDGLELEIFYRFDPACNGTGWNLNLPTSVGSCSPIFVKEVPVPSQQ